MYNKFWRDLKREVVKGERILRSRWSKRSLSSKLPSWTIPFWDSLSLSRVSTLSKTNFPPQKLLFLPSEPLGMARTDTIIFSTSSFYCFMIFFYFAWELRNGLTARTNSSRLVDFTRFNTSQTHPAYTSLVSFADIVLCQYVNLSLISIIYCIQKHKEFLS